MKRIIAIMLAVIMCFSLVACGIIGKKSGSSNEPSTTDKIRTAVMARANAYCMVMYEDVRNVVVDIGSTEEMEDGSYSVKGYAKIIDDYGDTYKGKFEATVEFDEEGKASCSKFNLDTPKKEK